MHLLGVGQPNVKKQIAHNLNIYSKIFTRCINYNITNVDKQNSVLERNPSNCIQKLYEYE